MVYSNVEYLDSSNGIALNNISVDTLNIVLDHVLVQVGEGVCKASDQASVLHGSCVEPEEIVLAGLQDFRLSRQEGFILGPGVRLEQQLRVESWAGLKGLRGV